MKIKYFNIIMVINFMFLNISHSSDQELFPYEESYAKTIKEKSTEEKIEDFCNNIKVISDNFEDIFSGTESQDKDYILSIIQKKLELSCFFNSELCSFLKRKNNDTRTSGQKPLEENNLYKNIDPLVENDPLDPINS